MYLNRRDFKMRVDKIRCVQKNVNKIYEKPKSKVKFYIGCLTFGVLMAVLVELTISILNYYA